MAFSVAVRKPCVLAGLDLGSKTIGVAVSDPGWSVASPVATVKRRKFSTDIEDLRQIFGDRDVAGIVIGLPLNMDGSEGPRAQSTRAFVRNLAEPLPLPVLYWDERLTTVAAERALLEADTSRRKRSAVIDQIAAAIILLGALDRLANIDRGGG